MTSQQQHEERKKSAFENFYPPLTITLCTIVSYIIISLCVHILLLSAQSLMESLDDEEEGQIDYEKFRSIFN